MAGGTTNLPQGPITDSQGFITLEWQLWLQNPQVLSIFIAALQVAAQAISPLQNDLTPTELIPVITTTGATRYIVLYSA